MNLLFSEGRADSCYSVPTQETLELMLSKVGIIKFGIHHESTRTSFETPWGKLWNLFRMKLTTDVTLLFLSGVDNDIFMGNDPFLQIFIWWIHSSQRIRRITWDI